MKTILWKKQIDSFTEKKKSTGENFSGLLCHGKGVFSSLEMFQRLLCMTIDALRLTAAHIWNFSGMGCEHSMKDIPFNSLRHLPQIFQCHMLRVTASTVIYCIYTVIYYIYNSLMFPVSDYHLLNRVSSIFFLLIQCMLWGEKKGKKDRKALWSMEMESEAIKVSKKVKSLFILCSIMSPWQQKSILI